MANFFVGTEAEFEAFRNTAEGKSGTWTRCANLKAAVTAATEEGSTILVQSNTYGADETQSATLTLNTADLTVKAYGENVDLASGLKISGNGISVSGFNFTGAATSGSTVLYAIEITGDNTTIAGNTFDAKSQFTNDVIRAVDVDGLVFEDNKILSGLHHALNLSGCSNVSILDNTISGVDRSGIQFAGKIGEEIRINKNEITLVKEEGDRVDADDAAIVFSGEWHGDASDADLQMTGNTISVSGSGFSEDGNDYGISGIYFGNKNTTLPSMAGVTANTVSASSGATGIKYEGDKTVDVPGISVSADSDSSLVLLPEDNEKGGVIFNGGEIEGNGANAGKVLIDAAIFSARATGDVVTIDGVEYTVGTNLFGSYADASSKLAGVTTVVFNGNVTENITYTGTSRLTLVGNEGTFSGKLLGSGLVSVTGFVFDADQNLSSFDEGSIFSSCIFNRVEVGGASVEKSTLNGEVTVAEGKITDCKGSAKLTVNGVATIENSSFNSVVLSADANFSGNTVGTLVYTGDSELTLVQNNEVTTIIAPNLDKATAEKLSAANLGAKFYSKEDLAVNEAVVGFDQLPVGEYFVNDGKIYKVGKTAFDALDSLNGKATGLKTVTVNVDVADGATLYGDTMGATVYTFKKNTSLNGVTIEGMVQIAGNMTINDLAIEGGKLVVEKNSVLMLGGTITADTLNNLVFSADSAKIQFLDGTRVIGLTDASWFENKKAYINQVNGTIYIDSKTLPDGFDALKFIQVTEVTGKVINSNKDLAPIKLAASYSNAVTMNLTSSTASEGDLILGDATFENGLTINATGLARFDGTVSTTTLKLVNNGGWIRGEGENEAAKFVATGAVNITNSNKLSIDLAAGGQTVTLVNNADATLDGKISAAKIDFTNNGTINSLVLVGSVNFKATKLGSTFENITIGEEGNAATEIGLPGANFATTEDSYIDGTITLFNKDLGLKIGKGVYAQTITLNGANVSAAIEEGTLAFEDGVTAKDVTLQYTVNLMNGATFQGMSVGTTKIAEEALKVALSITSDGSADVTGDIVNNNGGIAITGDLISSAAVTASEAVAVTGSIEAADITAGKTVAISGDASVSGKISAKDSVSIDDDAVLGEVEITKDEAVNGVLYIGGAGRLDLAEVTFTGFDSTAINAENVETTASAAVEITEINVKNISTTGSITAASIQTNGKIEAGSIKALDESVVSVDAGVGTIKLTDDLVNATSVSAGSIKIGGAVTGAGADITATKDAATYADGNIEIGGELGAEDAAVGTVTADGFIKLYGDVYAGDMTANGGKIEFYGTTFVAEDVEAKAFYGSDVTDSTVTIKSGAFEYIDLKKATLSFTEALTITGMAEDDGDSIDVKSLKGKVGAISVVGNIRVQDGSIQAESIDAANIYSAGLAITVDGAITLESGEASGNIQCASVSAKEINNAYQITATNPNGDITVGVLGGALEGSVPYLKNGGKLTAASTISSARDILAGEIDGATKITAGRRVEVGSWLDGADGAFTGGSILGTKDGISAATLRAGNIGSADSAVGFINVSGKDEADFKNGENPVFAALYSTGDVYAKQISASGANSSIYIAGNVTITEPTVDGGISASGMVYVGGNVTNAGTIKAHDIVIKGTLESAKSIVVTGGKIDIQKLGSVVNPNGDAINAVRASEDSNLGFTADSEVEGNIRFGKAADTLDLGNLKSFSGTIYMGGVSNADAYDTIKVGSSVFAEGTGIALNKVNGASNVNLAIEGGSLDLGNGTIKTSGTAANVKLDLATLSNGTLSGAKGNLALELGNTTLEKVTIGKNVSIEVQAGATAVLKDSVITEANAPELTIAKDATLAVEMAKADDAFYVSKDAENKYVAEGTLELRKGVITLTEAGAIGNIVLNGGDTKLILESGAYTLANEPLALTAGTMDVNSGASLTVAEGKLLSVDSARLDVSEGTLSITKGGTLALSGSAILMASESATKATDATVKLSGSAEISTGTLVMNGGTLEIENASSYLSGFKFNKSGENNVQVNLTDSSVTVKKTLSLANTAFSGSGVAKMVLETSNYDAYTKKETVELGAISIDGIDVSLMQDVKETNPVETLVLSVNGALALSGNFSVTADELNLGAGGSVTVTVTADTTTDKAMFNVGSYTDFTSSAITINASAEEGFSANLKYVLASGDHTDLFKIGSGFEGYSINYKDGYTILASNVTPTVSVTLGEQTVAEDGSYVYAGTVTMDGPSEITKAYCTINGVETALDVVDGSFSVVLDPTAAQFGEFTVTVEASNELGNVGIGSATGAVADMTAPTISISGLAQSEDGYVFTGKLLLADNVAVTGYVFQYYLGDAASAQTVQIAEDGSFSITLDASAPNYSLNFVGQASDAAGNSTELVQDPVAVKDVTAPVLGDTFQAAVNRNQAVFSWDAASDNVAVTGYRLTVNGTVYELGADALSYTLDNLASGSYEYTLEALDAAQNVSDVKTGAFRVDTVKSDIDGNGIADLLFHNEVNGAVVAWMDGEDANSTSLGNVDSTWNMIGTGDFNGDGKADILWQKNEGNMVIWNDGNDQKVVDAGFAPSNEWQIVGIGDFSGDGNADILWRNIGSDKGCIGFWGDGADEKWQWNGIVGEDWTIAGVGDFNGDGKSDILWHDQRHGGVGYWGEGTDQKWVLTGAVNANEWQILGVGDFDGNGTDDILWQNQIDGTVGMWGSGSDQNWQSLAVVDKNEWTFAGVADLNGNGMDDMIWRNNNTNDVVAWSDGVPAGQFIGNADKTWKTAQLA